MKKGKKTVACAIAAAISLSAFSGLVGMPKLGPIGADVVSAATGETTAPAKPSTSTKKSSTNTKAKPTTTVQTTTNISRLLKLGSKGSEVKTLQTLLNNNGYNLTVDGAFGKKTLAAVKDFQKANGLAIDGIVGPKTLAVLAPATTTVAKVEKVNLKLGRAEYAAHGTKCFTVAVVAMAGDKIAAASLDDYQVVDATSYKAVPNSDKDFGSNFAVGKVLASKMTNAATYSANMAKSGGATQTLDKNLAAVQEFAKGKTIAELEAIIKSNTGVDPKVDVVTGATLADTNGYLSAILAAAKAADKSSAVEIDASQVNSLKLNRAEYAAHGTKCFTVAVVAVTGDKIVGASLDDYQVVDKASYTGVPNSDKDFGANFPAGKVLASKMTNTATYSANMAKSGGATQTLDKNFGAVQDFAAGKTIAELEAIIKTNPADPKVDVVTGATLADTNGYLSAILAAAKGTTSTVTVVPSKIAKIGLGHITSISSSKDLVKGSGALGQVNTTLVAAGFDKDGKVSAVTIDTAQTKIQFNDDLTLKSDPKAESKTKVELKEGYGMIKASSIKKEWYQQAEALGQWMIGKTVDQIMGMKVVARDANHPAVPAEPDVVSSVSITVDEFQKAIKEAYDTAVAVKPGAAKLGLGHEVLIEKSKGLSTAADGTQVLPLAQVDATITVAAFDKDGKVSGAIIDNAQTKINFDKDGKVTNDKTAEIKTKNELKEAYGMAKASSIKKEWYEQAKAFANWIVGKTAEQVLGMKVIAKDANHPAVPAEPDVVTSVTISVDGFQKTLSEASQNAK